MSAGPISTPDELERECEAHAEHFKDSPSLIDYLHASTALGMGDLDPMSPQDQQRIHEECSRRGVSVKGLAAMVQLDIPTSDDEERQG